MRLSVIIATRDRATMLNRALASIAAQRFAPVFEVVVADNGSSDLTPEVIASWSDQLPLQSVFVKEPNRAKARNAAIARARGGVVIFIDDDVVVPEGFLAAHSLAHDGIAPAVVSGPIINVSDVDARPLPSAAHYSRAFLCTCNASVPRSELVASGGFDESFDRYGWEDTELGLRLRHLGLRHHFVWDAFLWHIKPALTETLDVLLQKSIEKARMAARLIEREPSVRVRLATGAHPVNFARSRAFAPEWAMPWLAGVAQSERFPAFVREAAKGVVLDGVYTAELRRALERS
ncbi:MAG TPA: glycosyltransferase [Candidatus Baltobacteraceae bacterium]|nr:glycosyltransferase [Candidatus Baltobacteraceae bacterium]